MSKILTTNEIDLPLPPGVKEVEIDDPKEGKRTVLHGKKLTTITTNKVQPKTKLDGPKPKKNYSPPLTTTLLHRFAKTKKGKMARDRHMAAEAEKKRLVVERGSVVKNDGGRVGE